MRLGWSSSAVEKKRGRGSIHDLTPSRFLPRQGFVRPNLSREQAAAIVEDATAIRTPSDILKLSEIPEPDWPHFFGPRLPPWQAELMAKVVG
jgi:hypothetical protein